LLLRLEENSRKLKTVTNTSFDSCKNRSLLRFAALDLDIDYHKFTAVIYEKLCILAAYLALVHEVFDADVR